MFRFKNAYAIWSTSAVFLFYLIAATSVTLADDAKRPPNIVLIMADDVSRDWIGCYDAPNKTPMIDNLSRQGVLFKTAWATPMCTPTRVMLLTGRYPCNTGWTQHYDVPRWGGIGLDPKRFTTFARALQSKGYQTVIGGKWQINSLRTHPNALKDHGFDEHCVWPGVEDGHPETSERYFGGHIVTNNKRAKVRYGPDTINQYLVDFVGRTKDKPFFIYYPMLLTHGPHGPNPSHKTAPPNDKKVLYQSNVTYMDRLVGQLVKAIDSNGLRDNTMVIFTTDNGSSVAGDLPRYEGKRPTGVKAQEGPHPKGKGRLTDLGAHVPLIIRAPWLVKANTYTPDLVDFTDFFPTFLELAGVPKDKYKLDGRSFLPTLRGEEDPFKKRNWIYSQLGSKRMIRDWGYLMNSDGEIFGVQYDPWLQSNLLTTSHNDKIVQTKRLKLLLSRFPERDAPGPFPAYRKRYSDSSN